MVPVTESKRSNMLKFELFNEATDVIEALVNNGYKVSIRMEKGDEDEFYIVEFEVDHAY